MRTVLTLVVLGLVAGLVLFEALFLDQSFLGIDNRMAPPFVVHRDPAEPARPMNFATSDINGFVMPEAMLQVERLRAGQWPLWNPYQNCGQPLLADMGFPAVYPTTLLYLAWPALRAYAWSLGLHLMWLGLGTYLLLGRRGSSFCAALFGAVALALCGFVAVHLHLPNFVRAMAWLPWILWSADGLRQRPDGRRAASLALCVGACFLAGFPQVSMLALYAASADFLWRVRRAPRRARAVGLAALALLLGGMLGAVQLVPGLELQRESWRSGGLSTEQWQAKSLEPVALVGYGLPHFLGTPVQDWAPGVPVHDLRAFPTAARWLRDDPQSNAVENTVYVGLVPLLLALLVLTRRRRPGELFAWGLLVVSLMMALGMPPVAQITRLLPGAAAGSPKRVLFLAALALVLLAVSELDRLWRAPARGDRRRLAVGGAALGLLGAAAFLPWHAWWFAADPLPLQRWFFDTLRGDAVVLLIAGAVVLVAAWCIVRHRGLAVGLLLACTAADLVWFAHRFNPPQNLDRQYLSTPAIDWLVAEGADRSWRFITYKDDPVLGGSVAQAFHLRGANGLAAMLDRETGELLNALDPAMLDERDPRLVGALRDPARLRSPLLDLLGVRYVVAAPGSYEELQALVDGSGLEPAYVSEPEMTAILRRESALPAVFAVADLRAIEDPAERLKYLAGSEFQPATEAVLERIPDSLRNVTLSSNAKVEWRRPAPERFEVQVDGEAATFLVVTESHHPGWTARLDGEPVPLLRADHAFLGVAVPAGRHDLTLEFRPTSFRLGAILSASAVVLVLLLLVWPRPAPSAAAPPAAG